MKEKLQKTKYTYICLSLITLAAATLAILISNGHLFQVLFFNDPDDTGMDFFNSVVAASNGHPYEQFGVIYPPLANLFFYLLSLFIPADVKANWPDHHEALQSIIGRPGDLRMMQSSMLLFLFFLILSLFLMAMMIHKRTGSYLLTFCLVFSAGTLAAIERGNVILIAFVLTFFFVEHYNDDNRVMSELSLVALAAAFGFKLYPCIFGLLLLKDHKFLATARCILYAVLLTVIPTFFLDGPRMILPWLRHVMGFGGYSSGETISESANTAVTSSNGFISRLPLHWIIAFVLFIFLLILFFKPFLKLYRSQYLFLIAFLALLVGGSRNSYNLIMFLIPFLAFLKEEERLTRYNCIEFLIYLAALLPVGINNLTYTFFLLYLIGCGCRIYHQKKANNYPHQNETHQ